MSIVMNQVHGVLSTACQWNTWCWFILWILQNLFLFRW